jgi:hypothetical protein
MSIFGFGRAKQKTYDAMTIGSSKAVVARPKPRIVKATIDEGEYERYSALAQRLNYLPVALLQKDIEMTLRRLNIPVYPQKEVNAYMDRIADEAEMSWRWVSLRKHDHIVNWHHMSYNRKPAWKRSVVNYASCQGGPYQKAVPFHILEQVRAIEIGVNAPGQIGFYVSDYVDPRPDPFICVTAVDVPAFTFGVWDEPRFFSQP